MRFLITGGAGFVGSHLADELITRGHSIHVLDDLSTGSIENIRHLKDEPGFDYTLETCVHSATVAELVDEADAVFHLAAAVGVQLIIESPVRTIETNVHCTEVVLAHAAKKKRPVFIASTSEVYGKSAALPFREDGDLVMGPTRLGRWSYACSKAIDEFLALAYHREKGLPVTIGRLFNTVGPRQTGRYGMVVPRFVRQALADEPITVFGDGEQRRCFCHVKDVVCALADLMEREDHFGEVFNIGSTEEVTIMELARRVQGICDSESEIVTIPYDEAYEEGFEDMLRRVPDTSKLERAIGWERTRDLDAILADVVDLMGARAGRDRLVDHAKRFDPKPRQESRPGTRVWEPRFGRRITDDPLVALEAGLESS
jgi:UDP-glucose 4-epimerase